MKIPELEFKKVYVVEEWATQIKEGVGVFFSAFGEGSLEYSDVWLVWYKDKNIPEKVYDRKVFTDYNKALNGLERTKNDYIKYLNDTIDKYTKTLNEIK